MAHALKTPSLCAALVAGATLLAGCASNVGSGGSAITTATTNLHSAPNERSGVVTTVPPGTQVPVFGCLQDRSWCEVAVADKRGWASSRLLSFQPVAPVAVPVVFSVGLWGGS